MPELPLEIWKDRIENELESLERLNVLEKNSIIYKENSVEFIVNIKYLSVWGILPLPSDEKVVHRDP